MFVKCKVKMSRFYQTAKVSLFSLFSLFSTNASLSENFFGLTVNLPLRNILIFIGKAVKNFIFHTDHRVICVVSIVLLLCRAMNSAKSN